MNGQDLLADLLREKLAEQPAVRRYANTVTATIGAVVGTLWAVLSTGVQLPPQVITGVLVLISLGTVVGVKFTPNGVTEKQVAEIEAYAGRHRAE